MTDNYPELNVLNVRYWYYQCEPTWSMDDIANHIGCAQSTVMKLMEKNGMPRRSHSEANLNRYKCKWKAEKFLEQRNDYEYKMRMKNTTRVGTVQKKILSFLNSQGSKFASDLESQLNVINSTLQR
jgi:hypothetical protein